MIHMIHYLKTASCFRTPIFSERIMILENKLSSSFRIKTSAFPTSANTDRHYTAKYATEKH